jgi:hypothetical protein
MPAPNDHRRAGLKGAMALLALALIFGFGVEATPGTGLGGELGAWLASSASARRAIVVVRQDGGIPPSEPHIDHRSGADKPQAPVGDAVLSGGAPLHHPAGATPATRAR